MPVYYSKSDEENLVFHVFLGCPDGSELDRDDRVEKLKKRSLCPECLELMKNDSWVKPHGRQAQASAQH
jgi:hypothetical protein